jgi:hypothetical protein
MTGVVPVVRSTGTIRLIPDRIRREFREFGENCWVEGIDIVQVGH